MKAAAALLLLALWTTALAFQPEFAASQRFWLILALPLGAGAAFSAWSLQRQGRLLPLLSLRGGDLSLGALTAALLLVATWLGRTQFASLGGERAGWLLKLYLQLGDPERIQGSLGISALLLWVVVSQELIFRGYVQEICAAAWGERRGFLASALAYALAISPTLWTLRVPGLGLNPLLFLSALLSGLTLGFLRRWTGRLVPTLIAQATFTYFSVMQFRLPGL